MATDQEIQHQILKELCMAFLENPGNLSLNGSSVIEAVTEALAEVDESEVIYHIKRLNEGYQITRKGTIGGAGILGLTPSGIETYQQNSGNEIIPPDELQGVLELLYERERSEPQNAAMSRDELLEHTSLSENELDRIVWYLMEKRWIEALTTIGSPWWVQAEIAARGRSEYESA